MPSPNGHDENRLNRIESALALVRSQSHLLESQSVLEHSQKDLLRSQVLLQDELRQFATKVDARLQKWNEEAEARFTKIETNLAEATDKINGLIDLMDRHLREHRGGR
jgi:oligoendopeptidase F